MRSRYLYNLQIYNVLILVSLSIEEDLVCSQARWWWFFLAEATLILSQSVSQTDRLTLTVMSVRCDVDQSQAWLCLGVGQWAMIDGESLPAWQQWVELSERAVEYFIKLLTRNFGRNHYFFTFGPTENGVVNIDLGSVWHGPGFRGVHGAPAGNSGSVRLVLEKLSSLIDISESYSSKPNYL